jgi:hypothetical protein
MDRLDAVFEEDRAAYKSAMIAHFKKQTPLFSCDHRNRSYTGQLNWYRTRGKALWNEQGRAILPMRLSLLLGCMWASISVHWLLAPWANQPSNLIFWAKM